LACCRGEQPGLAALTDDAVKTSEIDGEKVSLESVRSSVARRLGVDIGALAPADRHADDVVDMLLDATHCQQPLTAERLFAWNSALFATGYNRLTRICVGAEGSAAMAAADHDLGVQHEALNLSAGESVLGPWYIQNLNPYHGRLKSWIARFRGVATDCFENHLGWFRALERASAARDRRLCSPLASVWKGITNKRSKSPTAAFRWMLACSQRRTVGAMGTTGVVM
jgi:hypothetical protein